MNKSLIILLTTYLSIIISGCDMTERNKVGEIKLPVLERIDYKIEIEFTGMYRVSLEVTDVAAIPDEIIDACKFSEDRLCLVRELYGDMPWVLTSENEKEIVAEGNYQSIDNRRPRALPLFTFRASAGKYTLTFLPSKGYSSFAPKVVKEIIIE